MNRYDAIIIGAGHNGLVAAAYLAKAGRKVLVLERRPLIGGAAASEEIYPGFHYSTCAHASGSFPAQIIRELELKRDGLEIVPFDPLFSAPTPEGDRLLIWRDDKKTIREIERFSKADAANYLPFRSLTKNLTGLLRSVAGTTPPDMSETKAGDLLKLFKIGWRLRRLGEKGMHEALRVLPMCVADFLNEWFETDLLKATLAASGIIGTLLGPRAQGTAYIFLHHHLGEADGAWGLVRGGTGKLPEAIGAAARRYGAEIRTEVEVEKILVKEERAAGVALKSGEEIAANLVISNADCKRTFLKLVEPIHLEPHFLLAVRNFRQRGATAKVNLALGELPRFKGISPDDPHYRGLIRIGPTVDYLERASDDAKYGRFSQRPFLEIAIPSLADPSLAPEGKHVMSVLMQYAPYELREGSWKDNREALGDLVVETINEYAPNFKSSILHRQTLTPLDLEEIYGLTEGGIHHGELALDQLFFMRPIPGWARYRTPIKNLYLCGSSAHPGGGVTGMPGKNAAREILKDWGK